MGNLLKTQVTSGGALGSMAGLCPFIFTPVTAQHLSVNPTVVRFQHFPCEQGHRASRHKAAYSQAASWFLLLRGTAEGSCSVSDGQHVGSSQTNKGRTHEQRSGKAQERKQAHSKAHQMKGCSRG